MTNVNKTPSNLDIDNQDVNASVSELLAEFDDEFEIGSNDFYYYDKDEIGLAVKKFLSNKLPQLIKQVQSEEQMRIHDILAKKSMGRKTSDRLLIVELMESLQKEQE